MLRGDIVNGTKLNAVEYNAMKRDPWELRKIYAIYHFVRLRKAGNATARECFEEAARAVVVGRMERHVNWQTVRKWTLDYAGRGGVVYPARRGRHTKTHSYLNDPEIADKARAWLRTNMRSGKRCKDGEAPLTTRTFMEWVNSTLLKDVLAEDPRRKSVKERTICD